MAPKRSGGRRLFLAGAGVVLLAAGALAWWHWWYKDVAVELEVDGDDRSFRAHREAVGISTPRHYVKLNGDGLFTFVGPTPQRSFGPIRGTAWLRPPGSPTWYCGAEYTGSFSLGAGRVAAHGVRRAFREGPGAEHLALSFGEHGAGCALEHTVVEGTLVPAGARASDSASQSMGASQSRRDVSFTFRDDHGYLSVDLELATSWPERGDAEVAVQRAVVQFATADAGGSSLGVATRGRVTRRDGCTRIELRDMPAAGSCAAGDGATGRFEIAW